MSAPVQLAPRLDLPAASALLATLRSNTEPDVILDMSEVKHLGALCVQVLISAATTFAAEGRKFSLVNASDRVIDQLRVMGMTPEAIAESST